MSRRVIAEAPAKINLHLQIFDKRPDGFHDISSLFQALSLSDILHVRVVPGGGAKLSGDFDCPARENTIVRAADVFFRKSGLSEGLEIEVEKRIPAGAGLGGGSSDAAAVLSALNLAFDHRFSSEELASLGASIGSDVPFFLKGACALVSGRGEIVKPMEGRTDFAVVVLFPGFPTNTAAAYAAVDAARREAAVGSGEIFRDERLAAEYRKPPAHWDFRNDFYEALARGVPELGRAHRALKDTGADFVSLTGSGSALFGVFRSFDAAGIAVKMLDGREGSIGRWSSVLATPLARMPEPRLQ